MEFKNLEYSPCMTFPSNEEFVRVVVSRMHRQDVLNFKSREPKNYSWKARKIGLKNLEEDDERGNTENARRHVNGKLEILTL